MGLKLRYGLLVQVNYTNGTGKVKFPETGLVSDWATLPKGINSNVHYSINSRVSVIYDDDEHFEIINIVPVTDGEEKKLPPSWGNENTEGVMFSDGSFVAYDSSKKKMIVSSPSSEIEMDCKTLTVNGDISVKGTATALRVIGKTSVKAGNVSLATHVHGTSNGNSTPPIA